MLLDTPFFDRLREDIRRAGGMHNAHLHLDRAGTSDSLATPADANHFSLAAKHGLIPAIHNSEAYRTDVLRARTDTYIDRMVACGTRRADSVVDVTVDCVRTSALEVFLDIARTRASEIEFTVGAYSPLGYTDREPGRWELLETAAERAHFIGSLPERDDHCNYPDHIGFDEHCRRILQLAKRLRKPIHIHVDQRNDPAEAAAERVLNSIRDVGQPESDDGTPMIWMIHLISPSTYAEDRFNRLLQALVEFNIGIICCPSAAISMRQLRPRQTPTSNSIARVLDLLAAGIPVRLGSDNICDITSPAGTPDLLAEVYVLCNAIRFYDVGILAALAAGRGLTPAECERIRDHLARDREEVARVLKQFPLKS